jgi:hypothetical protein
VLIIFIDFIVSNERTSANGGIMDSTGTNK